MWSIVFDRDHLVVTCLYTEVHWASDFCSGLLYNYCNFLLPGSLHTSPLLNCVFINMSFHLLSPCNSPSLYLPWRFTPLLYYLDRMPSYCQHVTVTALYPTSLSPFDLIYLFITLFLLVKMTFLYFQDITFLCQLTWTSKCILTQSIRAFVLTKKYCSTQPFISLILLNSYPLSNLVFHSLI